MVKEGEVMIVDEHTGRLMKGQRWSDGLHQAVEAKKRLKYNLNRKPMLPSPIRIISVCIASCRV